MNKNGVIIIVVILLLLLVAIIGYASYSSPAPYDANNPANTDTTNGGVGGGTVTTSTTTVTTGTTSTTSVNAQVTKSFTVNGKNFSFSPSTLTVNKGDRVKITFVNTGGTHDLKIDGYNVGTAQINDGKSETFEFTADKAGTFEYYCSVGTHRQMGMRGNLIVK